MSKLLIACRKFWLVHYSRLKKFFDINAQHVYLKNARKSTCTICTMDL